ncbi:MAG: EAL domain-containing protein [Myxococcota bacterium]
MMNLAGHLGNDKRTEQRVMVVDDDPVSRRALERSVRRTGCSVVAAEDGGQACELLGCEDVDAVVTDLSMPVVDGLRLLERIHERDEEMPVILITGKPSLGTVMRAMEQRAFGFLTKPCDPKQLQDHVLRALEFRSENRNRTAALRYLREQDELLVELNETFDSALEKLVVHFQPIVHWPSRTTLGYEALVRSTEPKMRFPNLLFEAAQRLDREHDLGRRIRRLAVEGFRDAPSHWRLFVNLAATDLVDDDLYDTSAPLSSMSHRVVLEINEQARVGDEVVDRLKELRRMGFRAAVDDLGAGYAGLNSVALLEPEVIKLDMTLVRDIHQSAIKQRLVRSLGVLARDMGIEVVSEGVETADERDALAELGCDVLQGYFIAKPAFPIPEPNFGE